MILKLAVVAIGLLVIVVIISQLVVPAIRGTKLFPIARREAKLKDEFLDAAQEEHEAQIVRDLEAIREQQKATVDPWRDTTPPSGKEKQ